MKKMHKRLSLSRETLRRLDNGHLAEAAGGGIINTDGKTTADPTECTMCYICNDTVQPRACQAQAPIANPISDPVAAPANPVVAG